MSRVKTFDATGLATAGRLYAGDLNSIQDQYADLFNLLQALGVSSISIGESGLQLIRYGTGEARLSGALRTDGIVRALGGIYAGAFTTAQRDAITSGFRPYGLVVFNTTTNRLEINLGTDPTPAWAGLNASVARGTLGARPSPTASNANNWYFATDDNGGTLYYSDGSVWTKVSRGLTEQITGAMIPAGIITTAMLNFDVATQAELDAVFNSLNTDARMSNQRTPTDNSVSTVKLQDNSVSNAKMLDNSVGTAELIDASVTNAKLASGIDPAKIAGGVVAPSERVACFLRASGGQSLPFQTETVVLWDVEDSDTLAMHAAGSGTITIPTSGIYLISCASDTTVGSTMLRRLKVGGTTWWETSGGAFSFAPYLTAGTTIQLAIFNTAASTNYQIATPAYFLTNHISVVKLS